MLPKWCPILIVAPTGVVPDWVKTFTKWGHFAVVIYEGPSRDIALDSVKTGLAEVMVCPRSMFERKDQFDQILQCKWKIAIIDEFHVFKNEKGHLATNLRTMRDALACVVVGLTGTIMQNHHKELWNLIDLASKDYLGSWADFEARYAKPIKLSL